MQSRKDGICGTSRGLALVRSTGSLVTEQDMETKGPKCSQGYTGQAGADRNDFLVAPIVFSELVCKAIFKTQVGRRCASALRREEVSNSLLGE